VEAVAFLRERLGKLTLLGPKRCERLIAHPDSPQFETRGRGPPGANDLGDGGGAVPPEGPRQQPPPGVARRGGEVLEGNDPVGRHARHAAGGGAAGAPGDRGGAAAAGGVRPRRAGGAADAGGTGRAGTPAVKASGAA